MTYSNAQEMSDAFDVKHGNDAIVLNGWLLYSDGAMRELSPLGAMYGVPNDDFKCAKLKVRYWEKRLALAVEEFTLLRSNILARARAAMNEKNPPPPNREVLEKLKGIREKIATLQPKVQEAENNLESSKPEAMREREECIEETRLDWQELANAVQEVEV